MNETLGNCNYSNALKQGYTFSRIVFVRLYNKIIDGESADNLQYPQCFRISLNYTGPIANELIPGLGP